jgi:hypothetical protein
MTKKTAKRKPSKIQSTCEKCGANWSEIRNAGQVSKWCPECKPDVIKQQNRERARRYQERKRSADKLADFRSRWGLPQSTQDGLRSMIGSLSARRR